ncbi:MAG: sulfite exporter TauE/SafE family protein, partial [Actinomycetota bacterium]|nr:sulfite exporter TauE/SafE family protein [Actinomycetota bacterium]
LLVLPDDAFDAIVPALIGVGCVLVAVQPWLTRLLGRDGREERPPHGSVLVVVLIFLTGVYGGYFGAAQGVLLIAIMGLLLDAHLQRVNAVKNVLALLVNGVAAVVFVVIADPDWAVVGLIALGASVGGQIGATVGRRLPPVAFRVFIVVVGVVAIWRLLA